MPKKFKGLTDHPRDRKLLKNKITKQSLSVKRSKADYPPFLDFDNNQFVTINYYDKESKRYVEVKTTLTQEATQDLSEDRLNELAEALLTENKEKIDQLLKIESVEIAQKRSFLIKGNSSIKKLEVGVFASTSDDETALHYLLDKVRIKL